MLRDYWSKSGVALDVREKVLRLLFGADSVAVSNCAAVFLSNGDILNDLQWPLTRFSKSRHFWSRKQCTLWTKLYRMVLGNHLTIYSLSNGTTFNDLKWPLTRISSRIFEKWRIFGSMLPWVSESEWVSIFIHGAQKQSLGTLIGNRT